MLMDLARGRWEDVGHGGEAPGHTSVVNWENKCLVV